MLGSFLAAGEYPGAVHHVVDSLPWDFPRIANVVDGDWLAVDHQFAFLLSHVTVKRAMSWIVREQVNLQNIIILLLK